MTDQIRSRVAKVYELVNRGGTEGEKQAAKLVLDRMLKKYNLTDATLSDLEKKDYRFKYATDLEHWLLVQLVHFYHEESDDPLKTARLDNWGKREIVIKLKYINWVTIECSYEYFRKHMKDQWKKTCAPIVSRCRTVKTKNAKRKALQKTFFGQYIVKSKLFKDESQLSPIDFSSMTQKERENYRALQNLEGGQYNRQMTNGLLLQD
jgi:hypothetical protein